MIHHYIAGAAVLVGAVVGSVVAFDRDPVDRCGEQGAEADRLATDPALRLVAPSVTRQQDSRRLPCNDSGDLGTVGWSGQHVTANRIAVLDYYRTQLPALGWRLAIDTDQPLDGTTNTTLCFERRDSPPLRVGTSSRPREATGYFFLEFTTNTTEHCV